MSDKVDESETVVCRLCMSTEPGQIKIFGDDDMKNDKLCQKIKECLSIEIHVKDPFTKYICQICATRVEDIYIYQQSCIQTQSTFKKENPRIQLNQEVSDAAIVEAEKILKRLQAGGSALSVTPVGLAKVNKFEENWEHVLNSPSALSITPIIHSTESSDDEDSQWDVAASFPLLPNLKNPCAEDYILIQEETIKVDSKVQCSPRNMVIMEHTLNHKDLDIVETQLRRRVVMPPMWDVYEKSADHETITHRRYVVNKKSFSCSLCGSCVAFHCQQVLRKYDILSKETSREEMKQEDNNTTEQPESQQILHDLKQSELMPEGDSTALDCPECGKLFPRRSSWKRHLRSHFEGRSFLCSLCGKGFNRKEHLSRHMSSHSGGRPFHCECCAKPFTRKEHLVRHLACNPACERTSASAVLGGGQESSISRPYSCDICVQSFMHKEHLLRHQRRAHSVLQRCIKPSALPDRKKIQQYRCNICYKSFSDKSKLSKHIQLYHQNDTPDDTDDNQETPLCNAIDENDQESPEQIEVEVNLLEDGSDRDNMTEGNAPTQRYINEEGSPSSPSQSFELGSDHEEINLDKGAFSQLDVNKGLVTVGEYSESLGENSLCCKIRRDDDDEADDESGSTQSSLPSDPSASVVLQSKGQHPCSICGKMFGRRYHLVRHRRTQHGVESVRTGPLGRPPKRPVASDLFHCAVCKGQFASRNSYRRHSCKSIGNPESLLSGTRALAEMAAKISDKLHRGMDSFNHVCKNCDRRFDNKLELDKHIKTHVEDFMADMLWK